MAARKEFRSNKSSLDSAANEQERNRQGEKSCFVGAGFEITSSTRCTDIKRNNTRERERGGLSLKVHR